MKRAVVTGANGFVGKAVVKELILEGVQVYSIVREKAETVDIETIGGTVIHCDMDEYELLPKKIQNIAIDVFYHFAWEGTSGALRGDEKVQLRNVQGACDAVRAADALKCKKFIFASSIMQYEVDQLIKTEKSVPSSSIYCTAKIAADYMCRAMANMRGITYISALISNIYGPGETSPRLINSSIRKLLNGEHTSFSLGMQMYDFMYISDAAKAFFHLGKDGKGNKTYYIGSGEPKKLRDFLLELRDIVAPGVELGLGELPSCGASLTYREFDVKSIFCDTGFVPSVSFRDGIKKTEQWIREEMRKNTDDI